jgi:hypothetical protein
MVESLRRRVYVVDGMLLPWLSNVVGEHGAQTSDEWIAAEWRPTECAYVTSSLETPATPATVARKAITRHTIAMNQPRLAQRAS